MLWNPHCFRFGRPDCADELSTTIMSNLHAALSIHGQAVEVKNRRISVVNNDLSYCEEATAIAKNLYLSFKDVQDPEQSHIDEKSRIQSNLEFARLFLAAGSKEHMKLFQSLLSVLTSCRSHVALVTKDIMLGTGFMQLAMSEVNKERKAYGAI